MYAKPKTTHLTLPTVEGAFGAMKIMRDPPRGLFTYYRPKVFDTDQINRMIDESGDRVCEMIMPYARGKNPMVSVDYGNNGMNGGQYRYGNPSALLGGNAQTSSPYKVMVDGAFRPPIIAPEALMPLSRQPRLPTSMMTNVTALYPETRQLVACNTNWRAIKSKLFNCNYETPKTSQLLKRNFETNLVPSNQINNHVYQSVDTNMCSTMQKTGDITGLGATRVRDQILNGSYQTNLSGIQQQYDHSNSVKRVQPRNVPLSSFTINRGYTAIDPSIMSGNPAFVRGANITPKLKVDGSALNEGYVPVCTTMRENVMTNAINRNDIFRKSQQAIKQRGTVY